MSRWNYAENGSCYVTVYSGNRAIAVNVHVADARILIEEHNQEVFRLTSEAEQNKAIAAGLQRVVTALEKN